METSDQGDALIQVKGNSLWISSNQVLWGTYGGTEGIVVAPGENMAWAYYSINACEVAPLLILLTSRVPARTTADDIILDSNLFFHHALGRGRSKVSTLSLLLQIA